MRLQRVSASYILDGELFAAAGGRMTMFWGTMAVPFVFGVKALLRWQAWKNRRVAGALEERHLSSQACILMGTMNIRLSTVFVGDGEE